MAKHRTSPETTPILQLLSDYSFDVDPDAEAMVAEWLQRFEPAWVSQAITEALYQGRYKVVSVDHILQLWQRRGQPLRHFNREFESIILGQSWGQFLAATKAHGAANRDLDHSSTPATGDILIEVAPHRHSYHSPQAVEEQDNGHSFPISPFGVNPAQPDHDSAYPPLALPVADSFPASESQPAADAPPTLAGASSRTIPPLTPDQLARLTQPVMAPGLAANHTVPTPPQNPPPMADSTTEALPDESSTQALTAEFLSDASLPTADSLTADAIETKAIIANPLPPVEHSPTAEVPETALPSEAGRMEAIAAVTDTPEEDATALVTATEDATGRILPEPESFRGNTETAQVVIPNFQPVANRVSHPESADSIPPFVPNPVPSDFHQRLKAVVEAGRQEN